MYLIGGIYFQFADIELQLRSRSFLIYRLNRQQRIDEFLSVLPYTTKTNNYAQQGN